jgi:hypothetical protein
MFFLEKFKIREWGQVIRDGNDKLVLLYGGDPIAFINHRCMYIRRAPLGKNDDLTQTIADFSKMYKHWIESTVMEDSAITNLTISN